MLGPDSVNIVLAIAESGIIETAVNDLLARSQLIMVENEVLRSSVKNHLARWHNRVKHRITRVGEQEHFQTEIALYQQTVQLSERAFMKQLPDLLQQLEWHSSFYTKARQLVDDKKTFNNPMFAHFFCDCWYKALCHDIKQAQLIEIESSKEKEYLELYQRIETLRNMQQITDQGGEGNVGRLWDMASAKLSRMDLSIIKRHAEFLKKHQELQNIAQQLGRMASQIDDPDFNSTQEEEATMSEEKSDQATDDIVGIHPSDDLNRLLPNETLFLAYPELEVVFYKHLIDKRLMNYRMQGKQRTLRKVHAQSAAHAPTEIEKGPFIICVDASGSMKGFPEQCAKALAYALIQIALAEERDCYVVLFSTQSIVYELTRQDGLREASDFLSYTFHGGTDLDLAIAKSIEQMNEARYNNADLIILSDFIAPKQNETILQQVQALKASKNRFHAVTLSRYGNPEVMSMFDHCWHYHPNVFGRFIKKW
ncbi:ATPase RavA stimulator ViaA [Vibrio sp. V27_P1S3P104]|uniref:ATPase RavA stimulator ViaA n=1 Tax=unclassified Vibrio TaxID=2614977 RepID=UPI0013733529|nr:MULTISPECIES: ATPase RavA stimulator ViaA [unclassified Vibrio]NAW68354.1 ATPase RavA stimulator ViaA [Vibrio sp. V28_P6S34P95]NAX04762.1 ATPase RavA stimulator ViaA [Vibrio sp. V30_P3S12P165]NAX33942.1 ATPase RavA stimulator ViaA [Vibrio sp. V29_P1S30P107]NAX35966.1 ATPase RavA stimulator ViaA [Vibrio sp. V27_P1S3P104]NAX39272.1 ATPase RavA stimulator ViaA [Vibrio sp. V26_P1S5P106]